MRKMRAAVLHTAALVATSKGPTTVIIVHAKVLPVFEKGLSSCNVININWFVWVATDPMLLDLGIAKPLQS